MSRLRRMPVLEEKREQGANSSNLQPVAISYMACLLVLAPPLQKPSPVRQVGGWENKRYLTITKLVKLCALVQLFCQPWGLA